MSELMIFVGFRQYFKQLCFIDLWELFFLWVFEDQVQIGVVVCEVYCNFCGFVYGGFFVVIVDNVFGFSIGVVFEGCGFEVGSFVMINLLIDYFGMV